MNRFVRLLGARLPASALLSVQNPIRLPPDAEPQPDLAIVRFRADFYQDGHPGVPDIFLVIEVADTSLTYDRTNKLPRYAAAGIPEVWLADLERERVLVHRAPRGDRYTDVQTVARGGTLTLLACPDLILTLDDVFGPAASE